MLAFSKARPTENWYSQASDDGTSVTLCHDPSMSMNGFAAIFYVDEPVEVVEELKAFP
jgi:hypothetical protein